jgi:hypothetical protein
MEHNGIDDELVLSFALHAACEKQGPEGIVPVTLVFGIVLRIRTKLPNQPERMKVMMEARHEMKYIMAKRKVSRALKRVVPPAKDIVIDSRDQLGLPCKDPEGLIGTFTIDNVIEKWFTYVVSYIKVGKSRLRANENPSFWE